MRKQRDNHSAYAFIKRLIKQFGKPQKVITDNHSAYAFIKRLIKQFGKPQKVITDQAPSTKVA
ncbi:IS6 family transposase, partial [Staphylococcus aureus]